MNVSNRKHVLVTGGAGFIGSHFCERLLSDGCDVLCVDNFYSGTKDNIVRPMNLGNPEAFTIRDLAKKIVTITGSKSEILYKPLPSDDPVQRQPDITLAKKTIGWSPYIPLEQGLVRTVAYFEAPLRGGSVSSRSTSSP